MTNIRKITLIYKKETYDSDTNNQGQFKKIQIEVEALVTIKTDKISTLRPK